MRLRLAQLLLATLVLLTLILFFLQKPDREPSLREQIWNNDTLTVDMP